MAPLVIREQKRDMYNRSRTWSWVVLAVILVSTLGGLSFAGADPADAATEEKINIIPEPVTVLVLLAGVMLFGWRRTRRRRPHAVAERTQD